MSDASSPGTARRRLPRALRLGLIVAAVVVVLPLVAIPLIAWAFDLGGLVRNQVMALKPGWEKQIGRGLEIGPVSVRVFPTIAVDLRDIVVQAEPERAKAGGAAAEPLFHLGQARVAIAAWPLLTSLGKQVKIDGIEITRPVIHVVRFADGKLSYQDIVERLGSEDKPPAEPMSPETLEYLNGIRLGRAAITGAQVSFHDLEEGGAGASYTIDQLDVVATDVRLGRSFPVTLDAAVLSPGRNLHVGVTVGPVPPDLVLGPPASLVERVEVKLQPLQIEPLLRFVPPSPGMGLRRALVEMDLSVEMPASAGKIKLKGSLGARQLVLSAPSTVAARPGAPPPAPRIGQPTDIALRTDLTADPVAGDVEAPLLDVAVGEMGIGGKVDLRNAFQKPEVRALDLKSRGITFERIAAVLPDGTLPAGARLSGPIELTAAASGTAQDAEVNATVDLGAASLMLPSLRKPSGTALRAEFKGRVKPQIIDIGRFALVLGTLSVAVHGTATPAADFDLELDSVKAGIDPLLRLLPSVSASVPAGTTLGGELSLGGRVKKTGKLLDGDVRIELASAAVKTAALELLGGARATARLRASGGSSAIDATLDLGGARVLVPGTMDKAQGVPMRITLGADHGGDRTTVRDATIEAPGTDVHAFGYSDARAHKMELTVNKCDIDLARLATVMPMLRNKETLPPWLADGQIHLGAGIVGDPTRPETGHVHVDNLDLAVAGGHIRGHADLVGLSVPKTVGFQLNATGIDFDRILGTQPASDAPAPRSAGGDPVIPKIVKTISLDGRILVDRGRIKGVSFANFDGKVSLRSGRGSFDTLKLDMFDGHIIADGSTIDVNPNPPRFVLKTRFKDIHIGKLIAFQSPAVGNRFDGHGSLDVNLDGQGLSWAQIAPQLAGQVGMAFADGRLKTPSIGGAALGQLFQKVPGLGLAAPALTGDEISLRNLSTSVRVTDGQLKTTAPLSLATQKGTLQVAGGIGLDGRLALTGNIGIPSEVIAQLTQGRIRLDGPLPVSLKLGGTLLSPDVQVIDVVKTAAVLAQSLLKNQGQAVLQQALGKQLGDKVGGAAGQVLGAGSVDAAAAEAKRQLELEAQKRLQDEQAKLQAQLAEKLKQQAAAQSAQDAQKRLEEEAKKRLGKGLGGLFGR